MLSVENQLNTPLVSVIIPSYNRVDTVGRTIDSILNQQCDFDFEIIIGDDNSTEDTQNLLKQYKKLYPEKINLLFHSSNIGLGANWATCVKLSKAKYIANCDNDDYWHNPHKLQLQIDYLEHYPEVGICHSNFRLNYTNSGKIVEEIISDRLYDIPIQQALFKGLFKFCNATMIYRKDLINRYLSLDDFIKYQFTLQDWVALIILAKYTKIHCLPISTATFGIDTDSITRPNNFLKLQNRFTKERESYKYVCDLFPMDLVFEEVNYDNFTYTVFLNYAFLNYDFTIAKTYGKLLSQNILKVSITKKIKIFNSQYRILFFIHSFIFNLLQPK